MNVGELMTKQPVTIQQEATLRTALETMEQTGCHHMPVVNHLGTLTGVITSHDCRQALNLPILVRHQWQDNKLLDLLPVTVIMTLAPRVVQESTLAEEAIYMMLDNHIGCLPVMRGKTLVGIVTTTDFLRAFAKHLKRQPTPM